MNFLALSEYQRIYYTLLIDFLNLIMIQQREGVTITIEAKIMMIQNLGKFELIIFRQIFLKSRSPSIIAININMIQ